jgi:hypothetical protein
MKSNTDNGKRKIDKNRRTQLTQQCGEFSPVILHTGFHTYAQWARITRKLAKIITLLVLIETYF